MKRKPLIESCHLLRCPLCGGGIAYENGSLLCQNRHCFDVSKKGTVNFLPSAKQSHYVKGLFENRARVFAAGYYDAVLAELEQLFAQLFPPHAVILDAGCGEGFYASALQTDGRQIFGLDNAKEAIALASRSPAPVRWMVADLANVPLQDGCVDGVLNILSPANYREFDRLLRSGGVVIKVIPGPGYLQEIRTAVASQLRQGQQDGQAVAALFDRELERIQTRRVVKTFRVPAEDAQAFLRMTPMTFHVDIAAVRPEKIPEITVDLTILAGRKRG